MGQPTIPFVNFEVSGYKYQTIPLTGFAAIQLDRKVSGLALNSVGALAGIKKAEGKSLIPLVSSIAKAAQELSDQEYIDLVASTLSQTVHLVDGAKDIPLVGDAIGAHFQGHMIDLYMCMYKVWEANTLTPFALLDRFGGPITQTP